LLKKIPITETFTSKSLQAQAADDRLASGATQPLKNKQPQAEQPYSKLQILSGM
jgi:hypothetical protein